MGDMSREPSMEEILSSIRRVIARDDGRRAGAADTGFDRGGPDRDGQAPDLGATAGDDTHDDACATAEAAAEATGGTAVDGGADDVLELTDAASPASAEPTAAARAAMTTPIAVTPAPQAHPAPRPAAVSAEAEAPALRPMATTPSAPLVSPVSEAASRQSLDTLAALLAGAGEAAASPTDAAAPLTVNALAEAALRPMLKQWLDANLPHMVERLVAREIARITGGRL